MLLMITVVFNIFLTPGKVLWQWGILHVTEEGLKLAGRMAIRLTYLVIGSSLMTLTTTPNQLTDGLERLLRPLNKLHVPIHEIAMMMSIALRFIPILMEETDKIMKAQIARGADFETGNIIQKAKNMIPLLVPLYDVQHHSEQQHEGDHCHDDELRIQHSIPFCTQGAGMPHRDAPAAYTRPADENACALWVCM